MKISKLEVNEELIGGIYVLYATYIQDNTPYLYRNHSFRPMKHLINEEYLEQLAINKSHKQ